MKLEKRSIDSLKFSAVGIELAASIVVGFLIGDFLDAKFGLYPWMTAFWTFAGIGSGFRSLFRTIEKFRLQTEQNEKMDEIQLKKDEKEGKKDD